MNVHNWHRNGLKPAFATVEQWIDDQLGYVGAEDEACFATAIRSDRARAGPAIRILIASDKGLFDVLWERPTAVADRHLSSRVYRWADVRDVRLVAETRLEPQTLIHREPRWGLEIALPEFSIDGVDEGVALLEFWQACDKELKKVAKG